MANKPKAEHPVSQFIQSKLSELQQQQVTPVVATGWLIEEGIRKSIESRPGSFVRSLCRKGKIAGAQKKGAQWTITNISQ